MGSALLLCVIPCSPVYMGVLTSVVVDSLCYGGLPWQRQAVSAMAEYLGSLGSGRHPSPTKLHCPEFRCACRETLNIECFQLLFCLFLWGWDLPSLITWLPASEPPPFFPLS